MTKIAVALLAALALPTLGCKPDTRAAEAAIVEMTSIKDRMCACKDLPCAEKVAADMMALGSKLEADKEGRITEDQENKIKALTQGVTECSSKLQSAVIKAAGAGAADPTPAPAEPAK